MKHFNYLLYFIFLATLFPSCKLIHYSATKNKKEEILKRETEDYFVSVKLNLSGGCPKTRQTICPDSIYFEKVRYEDVLIALAKKPKNRIEFINLNDTLLNLRFDINYYPKNNTSQLSHVDTLLSILGEGRKFEHKKINRLKDIYEVSIKDSSKLQDYKAITSDESVLGLPGMNIKGKMTLNRIFAEFGNYIENFYIDNIIEDSCHYELNAEFHDKTEIIDFMTENMGIEFKPKKEKIEFSNFVAVKLK